MLVRIGGDVNEVVIWKDLRLLCPDLTDPSRVPGHDDVGEQCQAGRDRGHLFGRAAIPRTDRAGINRALEGVNRLIMSADA